MKLNISDEQVREMLILLRAWLTTHSYDPLAERTDALIDNIEEAK